MYLHGDLKRECRSEKGVDPLFENLATYLLVTYKHKITIEQEIVFYIFKSTIMILYNA